MEEKLLKNLSKQRKFSLRRGRPSLQALGGGSGVSAEQNSLGIHPDVSIPYSGVPYFSTRALALA